MLHEEKGIFQPHRMMGTAPGFVPETLDKDILDDFFLVSEQNAFEACRRIAKQEGLLFGITSGATAYAAMQLAMPPENAEKPSYVFLPIRGNAI